MLAAFRFPRPIAQLIDLEKKKTFVENTIIWLKQCSKVEELFSLRSGLLSTLALRSRRYGAIYSNERLGYLKWMEEE